MTTTWYKDNASKQVHHYLQEKLSSILAGLCPEHELSHLGISRHIRPDTFTEEIVIKLHLNQIGSVRVVDTGATCQMNVMK